MIEWDAEAEGENSVKEALEKLSSIGSVSVTREYSWKVVQGALITASSGATSIDLLGVSTSDFTSGDIIKVAGEIFTVKTVVDSNTLDLGNVGDYTQSASITVDNFEKASLYKWA